MTPADLRLSMQTLLNNLDYDFSQFSFTHFAAHLEAASSKQFRFIPKPLMSHDIFGVWLTSPTHELFLYEITAPSLHQIHILLHELAHFICQHPTLHLSAAQLHTLLNDTVNQTALPDLRFATRRSRHMHSIDRYYERQAETLANLILETVATHSRLRELETAPTNVLRYFDQLGVQG